VTDIHESAALRKAALWSLIAGTAQLAIPLIGDQAYPYLFNLLTAVGYGFILPFVAVLHVRNAPHRSSGAILGTIAGTAVAAVGLAAAANVDVRPASLFVLGMWWWTIGKMGAQTGTLPRPFGRLTAALGALSFVLVPLEAFGPGLVAVLPRSVADALAQPYFSATHIVLGIWLLAVAAVFARERDPVSGAGHR
jgi:hypothetical protein